jgi:hypothetical protein
MTAGTREQVGRSRTSPNGWQRSLMLIVAGALLTAVGGCSSGSKQLTLSSTCGDYFKLSQDQRWSAAQRLSIKAGAEDPGNPNWGPNTDSACGSLGAAAPISRAFGNIPSAAASGDQSGTQNSVACPIFTRADFQSVVGYPPSTIEGDNSACTFGINGFDAMRITKECGSGARAAMSKWKSNQDSAAIEPARNQLGFDAAPTGTLLNPELGFDMVLLHGACFFEVRQPTGAGAGLPFDKVMAFLASR